MSRGDVDVETVLERSAQAFAGVLFVVDDEDGGAFHGLPSSASLKRYGGGSGASPSLSIRSAAVAAAAGGW